MWTIEFQSVLGTHKNDIVCVVTTIILRAVQDVATLSLDVGVQEILSGVVAV